ncbi:MAG: hypothetical protein ACPGJV_10325 [Bacteriovoracaceae bacterium]
MNELFDKLILRVIFTILLCAVLYIYKYVHAIFYPSTRKTIFSRFHPSKNAPDTLHLLARIIGLGIIFSEFYFHISSGILVAIIEFLILSIIVILLYLGSIYIIESIVLYNFEYQDEVLKRKNFAYSIISFGHCIGVAIILKSSLFVAKESLVLLMITWLLSMVLIGFATKSYAIVSKLSFNRLLVQKSLAIAFSYLGFFIGWSLIIASSLKQDMLEIRWFSIQVILKIMLSLIIFPVIQKGIQLFYKLNDSVHTEGQADAEENQNELIGFSIYEGTLFLTSGYLTTVITSNIQFGDFYPVF